MKKKLAMLVCLAMLLVQAAVPFSAYAGVQEQQELYTVMKEVNGKNMELDAPQDSTDNYRYDFKNNKPTVTKKDNRLMWKEYDRKNVKKRISVTQAKKEVRWLFRLLRSQYGLYTYYGGDAEFGKAKKAVLADIGTEGFVTVKKISGNAA